MKYAVRIRNMLKGRFEVAIFETSGSAEMCFRKMSKLENVTGLSDYEMAVKYEDALKDAISYVEDLQREYVDNVIIYNFTYYVNNRGRISECVSNIRFVFKKEYVTVSA